MYVITGASGNIGKVVASELLAKGKNVWAIGRHEDKLEGLIAKGAEPFIGDVYDANFVKKSFAGATAAYCMVPPNPHSIDFRRDQQIIARNYVNAVKESGIKYVVLLSSVGAQLRNGAGVVDGLADMEKYFSELKDVNVLCLRPSFFMENLFGQIGTIKQMGMMGLPLKGDMKVPMVATHDIGEVVVKRLLDMDFKGHTVEYVLGQRDLSFNEIAPIIGRAIGKSDLKYMQFSDEDAKKAMVNSGFASENLANLFIGLYDSFNSGKALEDLRRTSENTTPTSIEQFANIFAHAYGNAVLA